MSWIVWIALALTIHVVTGVLFLSYLYRIGWRRAMRQWARRNPDITDEVIVIVFWPLMILSALWEKYVR